MKKEFRSAFESNLNEIALVEPKEEFNNRFTLYSTHNIFNFLLLDTYNGKVWQVQWSIEPEKRFITRHWSAIDNQFYDFYVMDYEPYYLEAF